MAAFRLVDVSKYQGAVTAAAAAPLVFRKFRRDWEGRAIKEVLLF